MVEEFDQVAEESMSALPGRTAPAYDEASFARASTLLGATSLSGTARGGRRLALGELAASLERKLQGTLVQLVARLTDRRVRALLRRMYFGAIGLLRNSCALVNDLWGTFRVAANAGLLDTIGLLWRLHISSTKKVALLRELALLVSVERLACDDEAFWLRIWTDQVESVLWLEAHALGGSSAGQGELGDWGRVAERVVRNGIRRVRWRIRDEWSLAPRPRMPDEYEFPVLSDVLGAQPRIALPLIKRALSRVIASAGHAASTAAKTHAA
jgi:hypothetical protein